MVVGAWKSEEMQRNSCSINVSYSYFTYFYFKGREEEIRRSNKLLVEKMAKIIKPDR